MESAVLVPALGVGRLVHDLRMRYDPSAAAGIPPHVTLMFPFVPPADLTEPTIDILEKVISGASAFQFSFVRVNQFEQGVVYLEPEPVEPFAKLTREIGRQFGILPYGGEFGEDPVIHLTVAAGASALERQQVANQLAGLGRSVLRADEAWLIVGTNAGGWSVVRKLRFLA